MCCTNTERRYGTEDGAKAEVEETSRTRTRSILLRTERSGGTACVKLTYSLGPLMSMWSGNRRYPVDRTNERTIL